MSKELKIVTLSITILIISVVGCVYWQVKKKRRKQ